MNIPSFMLSQDLAGLLITLTGQSIIVSLIGIVVIKLLSKQSAPVRSLVCAATIAALGLLMVISIGFRLSDISQDQTHPPILLEENGSNQTASAGLGKAHTFASLHLSPRIQSQVSDETGMVQSIYSLSPFSIRLTPTESLIINFLGFIWLTGIMLLLARLGYSVVLSEKFRNNLLSVQDTIFDNMVRSVAGTFWNNRLPELYSSPLVESPITIGFLNPVVIIPEKLLATLSENELRSILLHELSHMYHYDPVIGVMKRVVMAFHWWNPFVYEINRCHEQAREEVSDNYVLCELHPKVYTRCLMDLAEKVCLISSYPTAVGMAGRRFDLRVRVEQLLSKERRIVMNTKLYLKAIVLSTGLILTFMIAGLYADVKAEAIDDAGKEVREILHAINPPSVFEEGQHLSRKDNAKSEVIKEPVPDNPRKISKTETSTRAKTPKKQIRATAHSIGTLASAGTKANEIIEKQDDAEEKIISSQKEASISADEIPQKHSTNSNAEEYVLDEVTVRDKTTTHSLRMEVIRAEELKYEIFNKLNSTDDFDITCDWRRSTGSLLRDHYCVSGWMEKERRRDMDNILSSDAILATPRSYGQLAIAFADKMPALKKEMVDLSIKHPELATAMLRSKELQYLLEKNGGKGRIKKKISTGLHEPVENVQVVNEFVLWQSIFVDHLKGSTPDDSWNRWDSWCRNKMQNKTYQTLWARADKDKYVDKFKDYVNSIISQ